VINYTEKNGVVRIELNRPEKRNALNVQLLEELSAAVEKAAKARVVVFSGAGKVFCSGMDLEETHYQKLPLMISEVFQLIYKLPCITIAAVQGAALAGGAGLMGACDIVIAETNTKFGFPEVKRGLVPAQVMTFLSRQIGQRNLRELVLLGEMIDAPTAKEYGLINQITSDLDAEVEKIIQNALEAAPHAVMQTKALIDSSYPTRLEEDLAHAVNLFQHLCSTKETQEGMSAFKEKRKPQWLK